MTFRADINGLRAIAVLAVIAFHFGIPGIEGGFVGVDIFFVISGFLMTGIITTRLDRRTFSFPEFYLDRARRIVPALLVMVTAVLIGGIVWLLPQDLLALGKHAFSAVTFWSNMMFWRESGYFNDGSALKPLLHTWSLSVEWQFYLIYPLLVVAVRAGGRRLVPAALAMVALASFALSLWMSRERPDGAFFLLPPRAWEMLLGGLVFLAPPLPARLGRPAQLAGLALIVAAILLARSPGWPGLFALVPTLGTALVIAARRTESRITGNPIAAWVGFSSYSIYLWHWPLAVALRRTEHIGDWPWMAGGIALSLALGHLSFRLIERNGRRRVKPSIGTRPLHHDLRAHAVLLVPMLLVACAGGAVWKMRGLPTRFSPEVRALEADTAPGGPYNHQCFATSGAIPGPCIVGPGDNRTALVTLIGDSHAESAASGLVAALPPGRPGGVAFNGYAACAPLLGGLSTDPQNRCGEFLERYLRPQARPRSTPLVLIAYWQGIARSGSMAFGSRTHVAGEADIARHLVDTGCALAKGGPTWIMLPTPEFPLEVASTMQSRLVDDPHAPDITMPAAAYRADTAAIDGSLRQVARQCGVRLLDPAPYLCPDGNTCLGTIHHRAVVRDAHHLTEFGNKLLVPMFAPVFAQ